MVFLNKCRLCLKTVNAFDCVAISLADTYSSTIVQKLRSCVPEINMNLIKESTICNWCIHSLNKFFDFKCCCVEVEQLILDYIKNTNYRCVPKPLEVLDPSLTVRVHSENLLESCDSERNVPDDVPCPAPTYNNYDATVNEVEVEILRDDSLERSSDLSAADSTASLNVKTESHPTSPWSPTSEGLDDNEDKIDITDMEILPVKYEALDSFVKGCSPARPASEGSSRGGSHFVEVSNLQIDSNTGAGFNCTVPKLEPPEKPPINEHIRLLECRLMLDRCDDFANNKTSANTINENVTSNRIADSAGFIGKSVRVQTDPSTSCKICKKSFKRNTYLKQHVLLHSDDKPFQCNVCSYKCKRKCYLSRHSRLHSKEKFSCKYCNRMYFFKFGLTRHMKVHSSAKY